MLLGALLIRDDALVGKTWSLVLDIILGFILMSSFAVAIVLFGDIVLNKSAKDAPISTTFISSLKDDDDDDKSSEDDDVNVYDDDGDDTSVQDVDEQVRRGLGIIPKNELLLHMNTPDMAFSEGKDSGENHYLPSFAAATGHTIPIGSQSYVAKEGLNPFANHQVPYNANTASTSAFAHRQEDDHYRQLDDHYMHAMAPHMMASSSVSSSGDYFSEHYLHDHARPVSFGHPRLTVDDDDDILSPSGVEALAIWDTLDSSTSTKTARSKSKFSANRAVPSEFSPYAGIGRNVQSDRTIEHLNNSQQSQSRSQPSTPLPSDKPINNNGSALHFPWTMMSRSHPNTPLHRAIPPATNPSTLEHSPADYLRSSMIRSHPKVVVDDDDEMISPSGAEALAIWDTLDDANAPTRGSVKSMFSASRASSESNSQADISNRMDRRGDPSQQPGEGQTYIQPRTPFSPSPTNFSGLRSRWMDRLSNSQSNSPNPTGRPTASDILVGANRGGNSNKVYASNDSAVSDSQDMLSGLLRHQRGSGINSATASFDLESKGDVSEVESLDGYDDLYGGAVAASTTSPTLHIDSSDQVLRYGGELEDISCDVSMHDVE